MSKKHHITAIIYNKRGRPLAIGRNSYVKTHPLQASASKAVGQGYKVYLHAETAALIKLKHTDNPHKIIIFRFNADGTPAKAAPCAACLRLLQQHNLIVEHT